MTSSTNFKVTRSLVYTAAKTTVPGHINEDVATLAVTAEGFLKYAAVFDGAGGSGQGSTKSGKTQAYQAANFLAKKAPEFLDFSSIRPSAMPNEIIKRQGLLKQFFAELVADQALSDTASSTKVAGDPTNAKFPTTMVAVVSDSEGGLHTIFRGDSQIFGIFEKRIIPLALISTQKLTPTKNTLCFLDVGALQNENHKTLGNLRGVILCSDGFLENNSAFGFPYDDVIYTNLQTAYEITLNESTDFSKKQFKNFLDGFVGDDDKSMISLIFEPPAVLTEPFYLNHKKIKFKNQMMLTDELALKQRLLVLSTSTPGPRIAYNLLGILEPKASEGQEINLEVLKDAVLRESKGNRSAGLDEHVSLEYFYIQNQKEESSRSFLTLETLMMVLAAKKTTIRTKMNSPFEKESNAGLAETLEAISASKLFFDTTHLVATPLGLLSSDTYFSATQYANQKNLEDPQATLIEMRTALLKNPTCLNLSQTTFLSVPAEERNDFGCAYLEETAEQNPDANAKSFTLDTTSFDYVCVVIRDRELPFFKNILEKIPFSEIKKFRIFTVLDTGNLSSDIVKTLGAMQGLDNNIIPAAKDLEDIHNSPGSLFLAFIKKLVLDNKTSIKIQSLEEHKAIFREEQGGAEGGGNPQLGFFGN